MRAERFDKLRVAASAVRAEGRAPQWVLPSVKVALVAADALIAATAFLAAFYLREGEHVITELSAGRIRWSAEFAPYAAVLLFVVPVRVLAHAYYDLYRLRGEFSYVDDSLRVFKATAVASLLIIAVAFLYRGGTTFRAFSYSRAVFMLDFAFALAAFGALRMGVRGAQAMVRRGGVNLIPTLVVGRGAEASLCIREMRERPELGYRVIGVVENGAVDKSVPETFEGVPVIGSVSDLAETIRETAANEVIVADAGVSGDLLFDVMMRVGRIRGVEFRIAPSLFNCLPRKTEIDQIGALPMIQLFREPLSSTARVVKRGMDIFVASFALAVLSPLWLVIAALIKLDSPGGVFYKQERVGMDGRIFLCYKFRTMQAGADENLHREAYRKNIEGATEEANAGDAEKPVFGKVKNDPRRTRVGKLLRRTSLDELPQFLNVLRGEMSVVGARPPIPYEVEEYDVAHRRRLDMK
ncbi:MAG TPA: sugar transferase, partial [Pyrinomonadaceae bacterium]